MEEVGEKKMVSEGNEKIMRCIAFVQVRLLLLPLLALSSIVGACECGKKCGDGGDVVWGLRFLNKYRWGFKFKSEKKNSMI